MKFLVRVLIGFLFVNFASADVLYDNPAVNGFTINDTSGGQLSDRQSNFATGDGFTISTIPVPDAVLRSVTFAGIYFPGNVPAVLNPNPDEFEIRIFDPGNPLPTTTVPRATSTLTGKRIFLGQTGFYSYEMNLDNPITLPDGDYTLLIINNTSCEPSYNWAFRHDFDQFDPSYFAETATLNGSGDVVSWNGTSAERIFTLRDDVFVQTPDTRGCANTGPGNADLGVNLVAPLNVQQGEAYSYVTTVTNNGLDDATGVDIDLVLPTGVTFVDSLPLSITCTETSGTVSCDVGNLTNGASTNVTVNVTAPVTTGNINTIVNVSADQSDAVPGNDSDNEDTAVSDPDIDISDSIAPVDDFMIPFGMLTVNDVGNATITIINNSVAPLTVTVSNDLNAPFRRVDPLPCPGGIPVGNSCDIDIVFEPTTDGRFTDMLSLDYGSGPVDFDVSGSAAFLMTDIEVIKTADKTSIAADGMDAVKFTVEIENNGTESANVTVNDQLPTGLAFDGVMLPSVSQGSYDMGTGIWDVGQVMVTDPINNPPPKLVITAVAPSTTSGCITNMASAVIDAGGVVRDSDTSNNSANATIGVPDYCVDLSITADESFFIDEGGATVGVITFTIRNNGTTLATGVELLENSLLIEGVSSADIIGDTNIQELESGAFVEIRLTLPDGSLGVIQTGQQIQVELTIRVLSVGQSIASAALPVDVDYDFSIKATQPDANDTDNNVVSSFVINHSKTVSVFIARANENCFIATAAYGSYLEPEVVMLRSFRDRYLLTNSLGRAFVDFYYEHSPPLANYIAVSEQRRTAARIGLTPLIYTIKHPVVALFLIGFLIAVVIRLRRSSGGRYMLISRV